MQQKDDDVRHPPFVCSYPPVCCCFPPNVCFIRPTCCSHQPINLGTRAVGSTRMLFGWHNMLECSGQHMCVLWVSTCWRIWVQFGKRNAAFEGQWVVGSHQARPLGVGGYPKYLGFREHICAYAFSLWGCSGVPFLQSYASHFVNLCVLHNSWYHDPFA